jgi:hypothetical protein
MPHGKPAGVRCVQLTEENRCAVFGKLERPAFCSGLRPSIEMCGGSQTHALLWLGALEHETRPGRVTFTMQV